MSATPAGTPGGSKRKALLAGRDPAGTAVISSTAAKRPRKAAAASGPSLDQVRLCNELYEAIRTSRGGDNRLLCENFIRAPSRRNNPEFYKQIAQPIDFTRIQQKVKSEEYESVEALCADIELLISNAKSFFTEDQQEYKDACELWTVYLGKKAKVVDGGDDSSSHRSSTASPVSRTLARKTETPGQTAANAARIAAMSDAPTTVVILEEILASILDLADEAGRLLSPPFRLLMSPSDFPAYYETVKHPIDLKTIAQKVREQKYGSLSDFEKDIQLLCKNAKQFNEPGSAINKDASLIMKFCARRKAEMCDPSHHPTSAKIERNAEQIDELLRQTPSEDGDVDYSEDSDEDESTAKNSDPRWSLYWTVRNATDNKSTDPEASLADPFMELPSRSWYPDYYEEVHDPMSLFMINKKLKHGAYEDLSALLDDLILVFANAKAYNMDGSDIHDAACRLERITLVKAKQLQPSIDISQYVPKGSNVELQLSAAAAVRPPSIAVAAAPSPPVVVHRPHRRMPSSERKDKRGRKSMEELTKRYRDKLLSVWESVQAHRENSRWIAEQFMHLPSRKLYPDYYKVIPEPIDLDMIRDNIVNDKYNTAVDMIADFELMFGNARHYNEPESQVFEDANRLEAVFRQALKTIGAEALELPKFTSLRKKQHNQSLQSSSSSSSLTTAAPSNSSSIHVQQSPVPQQHHQLKRKPSVDDQHHWAIFTAIKDYRDPYDRQLCRAFLRLPSRQEYPDYYDVIRKPMDMTKIAQRLSTSAYENVDALCADFILMFDNACRYNEPESYIYKDALSLQRVLLQKKAELCAEQPSTTVPDVQQEVRNLLTSLFIAVHNHQDQDQRCYSDSLAELPTLVRNAAEGQSKSAQESHCPTSFDEIKTNIDKGRYRRLDRFQEDIFALLNRARELSRTDSQLFEDTIELQAHYIKSRDELCRHRLITPAFHFGERQLMLTIDALKKAKQPIEANEDAKRKPNQTLGDKAEGDTELESVDERGIVYKVREFAYVAPSSDSSPGGTSTTTQQLPHIMRIERLYRDSDGRSFARGSWCYRPSETFHLANRKFLQNEVFLTPNYDTITVDRLQGKCYVMFIRQYFKCKPMDFAEKDVYVCESRYLGKQLHFKKIKHWPYAKDEEEMEIQLEDRPQPLEPVRVASVFAGQTRPTSSMHNLEGETGSESGAGQDNADEWSYDAAATGILEKRRQEVKLTTEDDQKAGEVHYEQIFNDGLWLQLGDAVRVIRPQKQHDDIVRIDRLWRTANGTAFLSGPWFARPEEIEHEPSRMFVKQELFAVEQPDSLVPLTSVRSRASVLTMRDYTLLRPTEIPESDVFTVQYKIAGQAPSNGKCSLSNASVTLPTSAGNGQNRPAIAEDGDADEESHLNSPPPPSSSCPMSETSARPVKKLKTYHLSDKVLDDELFLFKTPIVPEKEMSPLLLKVDTSVNLASMEVDDDSTAMSLEGTEKMSGKELAAWLAAQPKLNSRSKSGYILFSAEIRKRIMAENPDSGFGDVSKKVGVEWKKLNDEEKKQYEVRADYIAKERAKAEVLQPTAAQRLQPGQIRVHCCRWQSCDHQFDDQESLYEHVKNAHTSQIVDGENQYVCLWNSCLKYRINGKPFPSLPRLHRHIKEKHLNSACKSIYPNQRSKNYCASTSSIQSPALPSHLSSGSNPVLGSFLAPGGGHLTTMPGPGTYIVTSSGFIPTSHHGDGHHQQQQHHHPTGSHLTGSGTTITSSTVPVHHHFQHPGQHHFQSHQHYQNASSSSASPSGYQHPSATMVAVTGTPQGVPMQQLTNQHGQVYSAQPMMAPGPSASAAAFASQDPGRMVVHAVKPPEPVFVAPPSTVHVKRVMHSEVYLRYIESLHDERQHTVSKWDKALTQRTATTSSQRPLPVHWLKEARDKHPIVKEEQLVKAMWQLRDRLIEDTLGISRDITYTGPL